MFVKKIIYSSEYLKTGLTLSGQQHSFITEYITFDIYIICEILKSLTLINVSNVYATVSPRWRPGLANGDATI